MSAAALIPQKDVERIVRGARDAGATQVSIRREVDGALKIDVGFVEGPAPAGPNPLDRLLEDAP